MPKKKTDKGKVENQAKNEGKQAQDALPPLVTEVPDPPVPNRAHTEM